MNILRTSRIALRALARNKMRSFLTALGIIIGVGAVIAMVSLGEGAKKGVEERFNSLGTNLLNVFPGSRNHHGISSGGGGWQSLKVEDAEAIAAQCDAVRYVSPSVNERTQVVYANKNWNTSVQGVGARYPEVRNWEIEAGTFFDEAQVTAAGKVCILGTEVKKSLFEDEDPIGKVIRVKGIPFRVLGILKSKGEAAGFFNRDDIIVMPYTTVMKRLSGEDHINSIDVQAVSMDRTVEAKGQIEELLRIRHKIAPGADDDFQVRNMAEIAEGAAQSTQIMGILLGSIASISLLVGGIGIMNTMYTSVLERTKEIGIMKAIGGTNKDILFIFLFESGLLGMAGGAIGIALGIGLSKMVEVIAQQQLGTSLIQAHFPLYLVLGSLAFSFCIGTLAGVLPARQAAHMQPVSALRAVK
jgi:putative ABC transport system permease protein